MKNKNHKIISIDEEKVSDKIKYLLMIKNLNQLGMEEMYLNIIRAIHKSPSNIILNGKKDSELFL